MSEEKRTRPNYSVEFKADAVSKCLKIGVKKTSEELGVSRNSLADWVKRSERSEASISGKPSYEELEREIRKLKKENGYISEINRVLKKSTAIFSSKEMGGLH